MFLAPAARWHTFIILVTVACLWVAGLPLSAAAAPPAAATPTASSPNSIDAPRAAAAVSLERGGQHTTAHPLATERTSDGRLAVAGRLLVGFNDGVTPAARAASHAQARQRTGAAARSAGRVGQRVEVVDVASDGLAAAARAYQADPRVRYVEADYILQAAETPNDPEFASQWGMTKLAAPDAWEVTRGSPAVTVAVLDCGTYEASVSSYENAYQPGVYGHADINGKVVASRDFTGSPNGADDWCDHGTHVAGIVAAATNNALGVAGVGYNTRLLNGKVLDDTGSGSLSWVAQGIYWAVDSGAQVINMSLSASGPCSQTLQDAINYAWQHEVVVVAAAGNDGVSTPVQPAGCDHTLAVASTTPTDARSSFSNYGLWVDVAAPGSSILSTDYLGGYVSKSGTSMASPHVAGLAALLWATGHFTSGAAVVDHLASTADRVPGTGSLWVHGRVNAGRALSPLAPAPAPSPTPSPTPAPSPPPATIGQTAWYFAEGYTGPGFDAYLTIMNPNAVDSAVCITYYLAGGGTETRTLTTPAGTRSTVAVHGDGAGIGRNREVSIAVESTNDVGLVVERPMYFQYGSSVTGGHTVLGVTAPRTRWYFAEGYTGPGFDEYLTIMNPGEAGTAEVVYAIEGAAAPVTRQVPLAARSRTTVAVHADATPTNPGGLGRLNAGHSIQVTTSVPTVVERPMYFTYGDGITDGHTITGAAAPAQNWFFAEGYTGPGFDEYLTILNPNANAGAATISYYVEGSSTPVVRIVALAASSRTTVAVHAPVSAGNPGGLGRLTVGHSAKVEASVPVVVERPMYFRYGNGVTGGHNVLGAVAPRPTWYFAEGYTGNGFDEYLTIMNPHDTPVVAMVVYGLEGGANRTLSRTLPPHSRTTLAVHDATTGVGRGRAVTATISTDHPGGLVVERPLYFRYGAGLTGGHDVLGYAPE